MSHMFRCPCYSIFCHFIHSELACEVSEMTSQAGRELPAAVHKRIVECQDALMSPVIDMDVVRSISLRGMSLHFMSYGYC